MSAIRRANPADAGVWADFRHLLWPEATVAEHAQEIAQFFAGDLDEPHAVYVAASDAGGIIGFVELSIRSHVPGCTTDRIGYVEGLFVAHDQRRRGVARSLICVSRAWALENGCREFASDRAERFIVDLRFDRRA